MNNSRGSQFWNGLQDVKKWFTWGAVHIVGDGKRTRFWHDVWIGSVPLKMIFPKLFLAALNPDASVAMNYDLNSHSWDIRFKRVFGREEMRSWEHLLQMLEPIFLSDQKDRVRWAFENDGEYTSKSMYKWLSFRGVSDPQLKKIWRLKIPMKIRIFLWQVIHDRLPTREQILLRHGPTSGLCPLCDEVESVDHLLFNCPVAVFVWSLVSQVGEWPGNPSSVMDLMSLTRYGLVDNFDIIWVGAAAVMWSLWNIRNKLIFEAKILKSPADAMYHVISYLQTWRILWDDKLRSVFDWVIRQVKMQLRRLEQSRCRRV
jgi:hypothetical protein